jgi:hypothetical protein
VKPSERSLFESEMLHQVEAAEAAIRRAEDQDDEVSADAARGHLDNLLSLARRNGLSIRSPLSRDDGLAPVISLLAPAEPDPVAAPAV